MTRYTRITYGDTKKQTRGDSARAQPCSTAGRARRMRALRRRSESTPHTCQPTVRMLAMVHATHMKGGQHLHHKSCSRALSLSLSAKSKKRACAAFVFGMVPASGRGCERSPTAFSEPVRGPGRIRIVAGWLRPMDLATQRASQEGQTAVVSFRPSGSPAPTPGEIATSPREIATSTARPRGLQRQRSSPERGVPRHPPPSSKSPCLTL